VEGGACLLTGEKKRSSANTNETKYGREGRRAERAGSGKGGEHALSKGEMHELGRAEKSHPEERERADPRRKKKKKNFFPRALPWREETQSYKGGGKATGFRLRSRKEQGAASSTSS